MSARSKSSVRAVSTKEVRLVDSRGDPTDDQLDDFIQTCDSDSDIFASGSSFSDFETDEGRISRALQDWMPEYSVRGIEPRERLDRELVYSARLGREPRIKRTCSEESITTQLSLLSCSSNGRRIHLVRRRRKRKPKSETSEKTPTVSKWVALASRKVGALDKMMKRQVTQTVGTGMPDSNDSIFDMLEKDEQRMVFNCGKSTGLNLAPGMKKSSSMTDIRNDVRRPERRHASAGRTKFRGKPLNFEELKEQMIKQRLAQQVRKQMIQSRQSSKASLLGRKSRSRKSSIRRLSTASTVSVDVFKTPTESVAPVTSQEVLEVKTAMWAGDTKILAIDMNREMTTKVKRKIATTTRALSRATGYGDDNGLRTTTGPLEEFPYLIEEDYGYLPKIVQKIRISPQLSSVIQQDIKVRMGRPRYHEISVQDLAMWDRGQNLDRTHRNLKVFNWLHSLREDEFDNDLDPVIDDRPPGENLCSADMIHVRAVDEPKVKPLFERLKTQYIV
ncbi:uncharacterized protein [Haliotis asinina]|uniref:uncharacterized protein n=1 Tax=Haliotis asinina TaxID=109174 RepID=UPI003531B5C4